MSDELKHIGIKGMKWGIRRNLNRPGGADGNKDKAEDKRSTLRKNLDSMKRERQWHSVLQNVNKMTTKDINTVKKRIDAENSLKKLSKSKAATKKDREDYLRRDKMSNQELTRKVNRLKAKESLLKSVGDASKEQREMGIKIAQIGSSLGVKYVLKKRAGEKLGIEDVLDAAINPVFKTKQDIWDKGIKVGEDKATNQKVKNILTIAKTVKFKPKS